MSEMYLTSRSQIVAYQSCPRMVYYRYLYEGRGVTPTRVNIPLITGTCVHTGVESLLKDAMLGRVEGDAPEDLAVTQALLVYDTECRTRELEINPGEDSAYAYFETRALIEALVRAYNVYRKPRLLARYKVLEVEREYSMELAPGVVLQGRPDALLQEITTGDLYIYSLKTASSYGWVDEQRGRTDIQGVSELVLVERELQRQWESSSKTGTPWTTNIRSDAPPTVAGVLMDYVLKGKRKREGVYNEEMQRTNAGIYRQDSYLIRPYARPDVTGIEFAWKYFYTCNEPHIKGYSRHKSPQPIYCEGGANHRLDSSWERVNIWETGTTIKEWVRMLANGEVQPGMGDPLEGVFVTPVPYFRGDAVESWVRQVTEQEKQVREDAEWVGESPDVESLDVVFPQYRHSCFNYNRTCDYHEVCHSGVDPHPDSGTGFQYRTPHHELELEAHRRLYHINGRR